MRIVRSVGELLEPGGEVLCYVDRCFLCWGRAGGLGGHSVWGHPSAEDAARFVEVLEHFVRRPDLHPRLLIADYRGLKSLEPGAFARAREHVQRRRKAIGRLGFRQAMLRPDGMIGSVVAGFYAISPRDGDIRLFRVPDAALEWLGVPQERALFAEVERIQLEKTGGAKLATRLGDLLRAQRGELTLAACAAALGTSARSLQRELRLAGTSFRRVRNEVRLSCAQELITREVKLAAIASALGFSTPQHFTGWFKRQTGQAPSAWRTSVSERE